MHVLQDIEATPEYEPTIRNVMSDGEVERQPVMWAARSKE